MVWGLELTVVGWAAGWAWSCTAPASPFIQIFAGPEPAARLPRQCAPPRRSLAQSKRHMKRSGDNPGGIISVESPLHYSNVALLDPVTNAPVRASWRWLEDGTKVGGPLGCWAGLRG